MTQQHNGLDASLLGPAIRAALGVRDGSSTIERFSETLQPTIDLWSRIDYQKLRGEIPGALGLVINAVLNQNGQFYVVNPARSNKITVVERWDAWTNNSDVVVVSAATEAQVTALGFGRSSFQSRDLRVAPTVAAQTLQTQLYYGTSVSSAPVGTSAWRHVITTAGFRAQWENEILIPPGFALGVLVQHVNVNVQMNVRIRERDAQRGELV